MDSRYTEGIVIIVLVIFLFSAAFIMSNSDTLTGMSVAENRIIDEHFEYLNNLLKTDDLLMAGPCLDHSFGVVVFEAKSLEAARSIMENDPAVKSGVMKAELHPFKVSLLHK